jgi:hypothetical protein
MYIFGGSTVCMYIFAGSNRIDFIGTVSFILEFLRIQSVNFL